MQAHSGTFLRALTGSARDATDHPRGDTGIQGRLGPRVLCYRCSTCDTRSPCVTGGGTNESDDAVRRAGQAHPSGAYAGPGRDLAGGLLRSQSSRRAPGRPRHPAAAAQLRHDGQRALHRGASGRREHAGHHLPGARSWIPDGLSLAHARRRRPEPARPPVPRATGRGPHPGAARRAASGWGTAVLHARERLRVFEGLPGDAADLGSAGSPGRHRPRDPLLPAGRDRHAFLSAAGEHARPSHRVHRPRR